MATTTKKNRVVTFRTSEGSRNRKAIPIDFRIEITPERELGEITAHDSEGNEYVVSIGLFSRKRTACCCKNKNRKKMDCVPVPPGTKCSCNE